MVHDRSYKVLFLMPPSSVVMFHENLFTVNYACQAFFLASKYFLHSLAEIKVSLVRHCNAVFLKNLLKSATPPHEHCKQYGHMLVFTVLLTQNQSLSKEPSKHTLPVVISLELIILSPALFFTVLLSASNHQFLLTF